MNTTVTLAPREIRPHVPSDRPLRILHVLDHSLPLHSGYTFRTLAILGQLRALGGQTFELRNAKQRDETERTGRLSGERYRSVYVDALKRCVQREVKRHG